MCDCTWKITRLSAGNDRRGNLRYGYILTDHDFYPGHPEKSWETETILTSVAQVLAATALSMGFENLPITRLLKLYGESENARKEIDAIVERDMIEQNRKEKEEKMLEKAMEAKEGDA